MRDAGGGLTSIGMATIPRNRERGGSQASTTSVPARGAVTMVSDAPMRSARSCMLVMPKPRAAPLLGDAAAVVGHRQAEADGAHGRRRAP